MHTIESMNENTIQKVKRPLALLLTEKYRKAGFNQ
jgi:hypothetical protein